MASARPLLALFATASLLWVGPVCGGQGAAVGQAAAPTAGEPAGHVPAQTVSQTEAGLTIHAVRISEPIRLDGKLDEEIYQSIPSIGNFIQQEPREGEPATEKTDVWILYDTKNIYFASRCWDSHPERDVANEMRRDAQGIVNNESVGIMFDTFYDKRNSVYFQISLAGGMRDGLGTDENNANNNWNTVWDARATRFEQGWTAEMVIPFKSLRYNSDAEPVWGVNVRRIVRWKNETSYLTRVPSFLSLRGLIASSVAATMVGLELPASGRNFEAKPYAISSLSTDRSAVPSFANKGDGDFGFDAKYGLTKGLTLDLTYNTDFAQVEDDLQQVNLTRFNLFFPERRDFFLEGQGIFGFAGVTSIGGEGGVSNTPVMFFSRRIGINNNRAVPIVGGARVTGRAGAYSIGALNLQAGENDAAGARPTNFSVVRIKRDLFRRSNVGAIYTRRMETQGGAAAGETFGVDALYSASTSLNISGYLARTRRPELKGRDASGVLKVDYNTDRYGAQLERLVVGANFNPEVGFLRRADFRRSYAAGRFSPRPARGHMTAVRRFILQANLQYIESTAGRLELRESKGSFGIDLQNGDGLTATYLNDYELLPRPFAIATGVSVPAQGYDYQSGEIGYTLGPQRKVSGNVSYQQGSLYGGRRKTLEFATGRIDVTPQLAVEPTMSANWVNLPFGVFTSSVLGARTTYMMSPRLIVSALFQYNSNSRALNSNVRTRWEYQPGSEMFLVYSDGRDTTRRGSPDLVNRSLVFKINRLFRF